MGTPSNRLFGIAAGIALTLLVALPARADLGPHMDAGSGNPCRICHDTASADPSLRGWAGSGEGPATGWGQKPISALCYSCHLSGGGWLTTGGHNMLNNAYADVSHGFVVTDVPAEPDGGLQGSQYQAVTVSGLPYTRAGELECTSCHNVHDEANRPFNYRLTIQELCDECHQGRMNNDPLRIITGSQRSYSTHPTLRALADTTGANIRSPESDIDAALRVAKAPAPNYSLGGHLGGSGGTSGVLGCQTCHAIHGPAQDALAVKDMLAIDNTTVATDPSALCEGCHYGGDGGEQVGAAVVQSDLPAGEYSDHPIDSLVNRPYYPAGAAIPANWTEAGTPNLDRGAQPFYAGANDTPVCSSCHDTHGGMSDTPLLRGPTSGTITGDPWLFSYDDWCFVCHSQLIPAGHHSTINTLNIAAGDPIDSQLSCGDCHGFAGVTDWTAHNGFWRFVVAVTDTDSLFCEACHTPTDPPDLVAPALKGQTFNETGTIFPSSHGTKRGTASHLLGPDSDEFAGVDPKVDAWPSSAYYSSYGPPNTGGGGDVAPAAAGGIICESCHDIIYNDGRANPGNYTSTDPLKAGWESNLLIEPYADDPPGEGSGLGANGVGSGLCTGCHTGAGIHHPLTGEIVSLSGLPLRTGAGSFADQAGAPGTLSFPNANAMDCDSCHRPHSADDDSTVTGAVHGAMTSSDGNPTYHILEVDDALHVYTPAVCIECHLR